MHVGQQSKISVVFTPEIIQYLQIKLHDSVLSRTEKGMVFKKKGTLHVEFTKKGTWFLCDIYMKQGNILHKV